MVLIVDDLLELPIKIGDVILNSIAQTAHKVAWMEYQKQLNRVLVVARHDRDSGKLSDEKYKDVEAYVFRELRVARRVLSGAE